jgi:cyanobactin maturation PatA/PatG family protease
VAVVDGPVDTTHPAFAGAELSRLAGGWPDEGVAGSVARHGTQVASVIFGQPGGPVLGVAPGCRGLSLPVFSDRRRTSQLELARAVELAVEAGADVINISGGQLSPSGEAEDFLARAVQLCADRNVLLVAAAGNEGCFCDHVPAALPTVLAVGALDDAGWPLAASNWGPGYQGHGILAPGQNILGAVPGSETTTGTGTSLATPIVTGVAALLLSLQLQAGHKPDPLGVRAALLATAAPCELPDREACQRFLAGRLDIRRAVNAVQTNPGQPADAVVPSCGCGGAEPVEPSCGCGGRAPVEASEASVGVAGQAEPQRERDVVVPAGAPVVPAQAAAVEPAAEADDAVRPGWTQLVYALGTLGYDFGTEARRDSFKQVMAPVAVDGTVVPANPYDARQMVDHLAAHASEAKALIWTLNLELTPIYAVEPVGPYASEVYALLAQLLAGEVADGDAQDFIERVSVPGRQTERRVRLFSGQTVPVVEVEQIRGLYGWRVNSLIDAATQAAGGSSSKDADLRRSLREFLTRVYYDLRNLGGTSRDRALNFAATNAFQAANTFASAVEAGMALDTIGVEKSPFCRMDSDCWDVKLRFFDPENSKRARKVFRFTIDVSDTLPVSLGDVRTWSEAG